MQVTCHRCGEDFEARRKNAKWCSDRCRKAAARAVVKDSPEPEVAEPEHAETGLVAALRKELETAGVLETIAAQQALVLATAMTKVDASGLSGLSKELSRVKAEALGSSAPAPADEPVDPDDELRNKRDAKRQAAREATR